MDQTHKPIIERLVERVYGHPLINNVERGAYVEHMIELALGKPWHLTPPWDSWDLEHRQSLARIEIKQSAARQPWHTRRPRESPPTRASFSIKKPSTVYWADGTERKTRSPQRHADLYVFAWHPMEDWNTADHRRPDQWEFFVAAETNLPQPREPKAMTISIEHLQRLEKRSDAEQGDHEKVQAMVAKVLNSLERLKADDCRETS